MRTEKELLQVLLDNMDLLKTGLCGLSLCLYLKDIIDDKEYELIETYIKEYAPKRYLFEGIESDFNWEAGEKQPRIDWLNEQINKL